MDLLVQLAPSRCEHASLILTSDLPLGRWCDVLGDQTVAAAVIDRIVQHADVHTLEGASSRLRHLGDDASPSVRAEQAYRTTTNVVPASRSTTGSLLEQRCQAWFRTRPGR